jgi:hypothetical protein
MNKKDGQKRPSHYCLRTKLLLTSCSPAEPATLHLVNQNSVYFIYEKSTIFDHITKKRELLFKQFSFNK